MKAAVKATIQATFGRLPGGPNAYRFLTRHVLGTQSTHIDKLAHVWPGYVGFWQSQGVELNGAAMWMHGGGWTVYPCLLAYMLTGKGGILTVWESAADEQYTAKSIDFALKQSFGSYGIPHVRIEVLESLRGGSARSVLEAIGARIIRSDRVSPDLPESSVDLLVTGGILEHFKPPELKQYLAASFRIIRPGGWCSHVFDLRDHLYHADHSIPFLNHLRFPEPSYRLRYGHPLGYHNRLLPARLETLIREAGFELSQVRRLTLPDKRWVQRPEDFSGVLTGLDRARLDPQFVEATDEDLKTAAIQFLLRKPDLG